MTTSERSEPWGAGEREGKGGGVPPGNAAAEAAKLFDAIGEWLARRSDGAGAGAPWSGSAGDHLATGSPSCQLCPLCRIITAARVAGPEVAAHLDDALRSLISALRLGAEAMVGDPSRDGSAKGFETIVID